MCVIRELFSRLGTFGIRKCFSFSSVGKANAHGQIKMGMESLTKGVHIGDTTGLPSTSGVSLRLEPPELSLLKNYSMQVDPGQVLKNRLCRLA